MATHDALIGSAEACRLLGVSRATLVRSVHAGKITPAQQLPGQSGAYLFTRAEVERVAAERVTA